MSWARLRHELARVGGDRIDRMRLDPAVPTATWYAALYAHFWWLTETSADAGRWR